MRTILLARDVDDVDVDDECDFSPGKFIDTIALSSSDPKGIRYQVNRWWTM